MLTIIKSKDARNTRPRSVERHPDPPLPITNQSLLQTLVGKTGVLYILTLNVWTYKKQRAARELLIDTKTVRKYWDMSESVYSEYLLETKERTKISCWSKSSSTRRTQAPSSTITCWRRSGVCAIAAERAAVCVQAAGRGRDASAVKDPSVLQGGGDATGSAGAGGHGPKGDAGQLWEEHKDVHLRHGAERVSVQVRAVSVGAVHRGARRSIPVLSGRPKEIVYDQDRVMVVSENAGDIILTEAFEQYQSYARFSVHLCRGFDPESKG